jgi:DnaJ like chaperone protein
MLAMTWRTISHAFGLSPQSAPRRWLDKLWSSGSRDLRSGVRGAGFTIAVVSLCAKMSKADGIALSIEAETFERMFRFDPGEMVNVRRVFDNAKTDVAGFETYARSIAASLADDPDIKLAVFEALFQIATADTILHEAEDAFLADVAEIFGVSPREYRAIRAQFVHDETDPYVVLAIAHDASDEQVKARYRALVRDHHPDRLMARGVPQEFLDAATEQMAMINAAYDAITRERGL